MTSLLSSDAASAAAWCSCMYVCVFLLIESNLAAKWQFTSFVCLRVAMVDLEREH